MNFNNIRNNIKKDIKNKYKDSKVTIKTNKLKNGIYFNISIFIGSCSNIESNISFNDILENIDNIVKVYNVIEKKENHNKSLFLYNITIEK